MKKNITFILIILSVLLFSCNQNKPETVSKKAIALNDSAINLVMLKGHDSATMNTAIDLLEQAITTDSNYTKAYSNKLYFERIQKNFKGALATSLRLAKLFPEDASTIFNTGMLFEKTGDTISAQKYYLDATELFSKQIDNNKIKSEKNFDPLVEKGVCLILQGKPTQGNQTIKLAYDCDGGTDHQKMVLDGYSTLSRNELFNQWLYGNPMLTFGKKGSGIKSKDHMHSHPM